MLIRSQDKKKLVNMDNVTFLDFVRRNKAFTMFANMNNNCMDIGVYSTEEKAVKVLDMIQEAYLQTKTYKQNATEIEVSISERFVFQMPEDSEVE